MRTTVRIDDDVLRDLKLKSQREKTSLARMVNLVLRHGLAAIKLKGKASNKPFRQKTFSMGPPLVDITKALALAAELEDQETIAKLERRK